MVKKFFKKYKLAFFALLAAILIIGGGISGAIFVRIYFADSAYNFSPFGNIDFSQGRFKEQGLVISNAKNVIVQQDAKVNETVSAVSSGFVGIYRKQEAKAGDAFALENFYKLGEAVGQGFIITADGWIVTSLPLEKTYSGYAVMTKDKKIYSIDKIVFDKFFNFIHIPAKDLPVRRFAEKPEIKAGSLAIGVNWSGSSWLSALQGFRGQASLVKSSDNFSDKLILNNHLPEDFGGAVIFNLAGDALGIADAKGEIEPMPRLTSAANSLFKNKVIKRPSLGVNYIDLTQLAAIQDLSNRWQKGAIIYKDQKGVAVVKNSPAERAGLREGDIIISVDNVKLDQNNDLADIIQSRAFTDKVILLIKRGGEEKEIEITLAEQK